MKFETRTVVANGVEFGTIEAGKGPLALCLHGFPDTAHTWRHLLPVLAERGFRAVAPFQRGYAPTAVPADGSYQTGALASDAVALHEALGGQDDAVLIGHDWGAVAAYGASALAPERWGRMVAISVPPATVQIADYEQYKRWFYLYLFQTPLAERVVAADKMAFLDALWRDWAPGYDAYEDLAQVKEALGDPKRLSAALGYYRALFDPARHVRQYAAAQSAALRKASTPTLYLHGDEDGCLRVPNVGAVVPHLADGSHAVLLKGVGHFPQLEAPEAVAELVLDWIG
ncbi:MULTISPECIES: alpha/beta fold hydrolase [Streptomyces]|uniref:Alpha/beta fold hydrolase n=1 Tax=Streptomyces eurythermus TaxID=42237 RepID=A0ABW6Z973_9ACTN|nr:MULTISPECIES: alpha/beta hydrolase [Streptomyces]QIS68705.1 alpha/beta hydrolase [Streptomyces sp. DSM 40868]